MKVHATALSIIMATAPLTATAQQNLGAANFVANGETQSIVQTVPEASDFFVVRECADFCIAPQTINSSIETVGEAEVLDFLTATVANGRGLLIDARTSADRASGFIAASINMPHALLTDENPFAEDILVAMGATKSDIGLTFGSVLPVIVFDDGPTAQDAQTLIETLLSADYPAAQIRYYRGGMLTWSALGLSVETP